MPMKVTEARELKKLVVSDYDALEAEVYQRAQSYINLIEAERNRRNRIAKSEAHKKLMNLQRRFRRLQRDAEDFFDALAENGWTINTYRGNAYPFSVELDIDKARPPAYDEHPDLDQLRTDLDVQRADAVRTLSSQEQKFLRDLTLNMLESEDAIEFVNQIPTVDDVLPMPTSLTQLEA